MEKLKLVSKFSTKTSRGMLSKAWYTDGKNEFLVKGNSKDKGIIGYEPFSEALACRIAVILGLDAVKYEVLPNTFKEIQTYGLNYVSICKKYTTDNQVTLPILKWLDSNSSKKVTDYWTACNKMSPDILTMYRMLVFDTAIGNMDRHLNNWDIIVYANGQSRMAPIMDNGASLLAWVSNDTIVKNWVIGPDKSKPFRKTHVSQQALIKKMLGGRKLFRQFSQEQYMKRVIHECESILKMMPEIRAQAILKYINNRYKFIEAVM